MNKQTQNSSQLKTSVIGIDLGSYYTKIAAVQKGVVEIITNEANLRQTPTLVGYGSKERLIGETGYSKMKSNLPNTIVAPHRYLGFSQSEFTKEEAKFAPCPPRYDQDKLTFRVVSQGQQVNLTAEQVTAAFLNKVGSIVALNQLSNKFQVLAVPNYLTHGQRKALLDSISIARESQNEKYGYQVISESTAIGMDYGFYKMNEFPEKEENAKTIVFVDFGHSKLSLYAIKFTKHYQKVIYQKHHRQLGCKHLDQLMLQYYADLFDKANPDAEISLVSSRKAVQKLLEGIERQRKVLTGISEYDFSIECLLEDKDFCYNMTRQQFEEISQPVLSQIAALFRETKQQLLAKGQQISQIELIGGGSRVPSFIKLVSEVFGLNPSRTLNSSQCIARGAALCAVVQSGLFRVKQFYSFDLSTESLICSWKGEGESIQNEANQVVVLSEDQTLFREKRVELSINPTEKVMIFEIKTANAVSGINPAICSFALAFEEDAINSQVKVQLVIQLDSNRLFKRISAFEVGQKEKSLVVSKLCFNNRLSEDNIQAMIKDERHFLLRDAQIIQSYEERNSFESKIYTFKDKLNTFSLEQKTKDFVDPDRLSQVLSYFNQLESRLDELNYGQEVAKVEDKFNEFVGHVNSLQNQYAKVQEELAKLNQFIEAAVAGKIKAIRFYPGEQVDRTKKWIHQKQQQLRKGPKYGELPTSVDEIKSVSQSLKHKIQECQAEELKKQKQAERQFYYQPPKSSGRSHQGSPFDYNPFGNGFRGHETRGRGRSGYNTYSPGFFPNFSTFF